MEIDGHPFVPPTCPLAVEPAVAYVHQLGFVLQIVSCDGYVSPAAEASELEPDGSLVVQGKFHTISREGQVQQELLTGTVKVEDDTAVDHKLHEIWTSPDHERRIIELGRRLCDRVRRCEGIKPGVECWALGSQALRETIENLD